MRAVGRSSRVSREGRRLDSKAPIFTRDFVLVCLATLLASFTQSLVLTAIPLLLKQMGLAAGFVGGFLGAFAMCALIARFPVGGAVDRFGSRAFRAGGAGLLGVACVLYILVPLVPVRMPFAAAVPLLLPLAGIAHAVGFSTYGTSAISFVAYTVPLARRGEAVGYYGILRNIATGIAAGVSLLVVAAWGFSALLGTATVMAALAAILSSCLRDAQWTRDSGGSTAGPFRIETKVLMPSLVSTTLAASNGTALAFVPLLGLERGIANPGLYFTAVALTSIVFRVIAGRLADTYGRFASIIPGMISATAGLVLVAKASSTGMLVLAGILYGIGSASAIPALEALAIDLAGPDQRGSAMATYWAMVDLGVSVGSIVAGQIAPTVGYGGVFVAASSAPLVGLCFLAYVCLRRALPSGHNRTR
jgi:MFS family permease